MKMNHVIPIAFILAASQALADDSTVRGYYRQNGTYVAPHHRTTPDATPINNYGTQGNYNPYSGQTGTINPYTQPAPQPRIQPMQPIQPVQPIQPYGSTPRF